MIYLGVLSYSLYIWQQPFFLSQSDTGLMSIWFLNAPWNIGLIIAVAMASYHFLERPLIDVRNRLADRHRPTERLTAPNLA